MESPDGDEKHTDKKEKASKGKRSNESNKSSQAEGKREGAVTSRLKRAVKKARPYVQDLSRRGRVATNRTATRARFKKRAHIIIMDTYGLDTIESGMACKRPDLTFHTHQYIYASKLAHIIIMDTYGWDTIESGSA